METKTFDDPVRQLVRAKIAEHHLDMANISKALDRNPAYIQQFLERGSPKVLPEPVRPKLAEMLKIDENSLRAPERGEHQQGRAIQGSKLFQEMNQVLSRPSGGDTVPVYGVGEGGSDGEQEWNGEIVEYVARPEALLGVPGAYAAYVLRESMIPRYRHGELVYMHPSRPISKGSFVFVQLGEPDEPHGPTKRAIIKEFVRQTAHKLVLAQLNPPMQIEIDNSRVKRIHRIVASGEP